MNERPRPDSLKQLDDRLRRLRERDEGGKRGIGRSGAASGIALATRICVELVAAIVVGVGIGWLLDRWLGTTPWLMLLLFVLGFAAGVMNVYRVVSGQGQGVGYRRETKRSQDRAADNGSE